jgi:hypothetical protein
MADPKGPDDEATPVDLKARDPSWPRPSRPHPFFAGPRDSRPPHPVASPQPPKPPLDEPKTNPGGVATNAYVKRKLKRQSLAGTIVALLGGGGGFGVHYMHSERQARFEQKLDDHVKDEGRRLGELSEQLQKLLDLALQRKDGR